MEISNPVTFISPSMNELLKYIPSTARAAARFAIDFLFLYILLPYHNYLTGIRKIRLTEDIEKHIIITRSGISHKKRMRRRC